MRFGAPLFVAFALISSTALAQTVSVTGGQIQGSTLEKGGALFKGIPYAAPPVGDLRWREPMALKSWSGVRAATSFGAGCPQRGGAANQPTNEDCLFLNVWTPEWPSLSRKPVMVWIHGGANVQGEGSQPVSDGEKLASHGVVVVSVNYRLGSFGFFSHPSLTNESPNHASGNQGILDQIAALKWVRDNIASFGGDPDNITIFGESAGSFDVSVLMTSPLSKGLFRRAIGESGAVILIGDPLPLAQAEKRGEDYAARLHVTGRPSLRALRAVPTEDILKADPDYIATNYADLPPNLGIVVDGYVFPKKPAEVFAAGQEHRVAMLLGSNSRDIATPRPPDLQKAIESEYGPIAPRAQSFYGASSDPLYGSPIEQWAVDTQFRCPTMTQQAWHSAAGNSAYQFEFARVPSGREAVGATHGSEIPYVFGNLNRGMFRAGTQVRADTVDAQVSNAMQQYWTNFAKTGDPNGPGLPVWPKFDPAKRAYIQFTDAGPVAKEGLRRQQCDLFIENVKRQMAR